MRAKLEIVPRPGDVGRNGTGAEQASLRRANYKDSLSSELGVAPASRVRVQRPQSSIEGGAVVLAVVAAIITFLLVLLLLMWRDGNLPRLWPDRGFNFAPRGPTTDWMSGGEKHRVVIRHGPKTAAAPAVADAGPIDAKAEWDAANPPPPKSEDDASDE